MHDNPAPRLEGWDQIAGHFGVTVRTAQLWEKENGMPVHRFRKRVSADPAELDRWRLTHDQVTRPRADSAEPGSETEPEPETDADADGGTQPVDPPLAAAAPAASPTAPLPASARASVLTPSPAARRGAWNSLAAGILLVVLVAVIGVVGVGAWRDVHRSIEAVRVKGRLLSALDAEGKVLWTHEFPWDLREETYTNQNSAAHLVTIASLEEDPNGKKSLIFVADVLDALSKGHLLFCFGPDGTVRWQFRPGRTVDDFGGSHMVPPYYISYVMLVPGKNRAETRVVVGSNHYMEQPYQVSFIDVNGRVAGEYWHPGHLLHETQADLNHDGRLKVLLAGVSNGDHRAALVVLDPLKVSGVTTRLDIEDRRFALRDMPEAKEEAVILFPRSCLAVGKPYTRVVTLAVTQERIFAAIVEGEQDPGIATFGYEFDHQLNPIEVKTLGSHAAEIHDSLAREGKLDHAFREKEELAELKARVVVKRRGEDSRLFTNTR